MANFLQGFTQGFALMDSLETNRERREAYRDDRAWQSEARSRTREIWQREDEQWAQAELTRRRADYRAQFEAYTDDAMRQLAARPEFAELAAPEQMRAVTQLALNNMVSASPDFGEHVALANGRDPAAGRFVANKKHPVQNLVITEDGRITYGLNTTNGVQPMTENRSDDPNDPVVGDLFGQGDLVRYFGPEILQNNTHAIWSVLTQFANESTPAITPTLGTTRAATGGAAPSTPASTASNPPGAAAGGAAPSPDLWGPEPTAEELAAGRARFDAMDASAASQLGPPGTGKDMEIVQPYPERRGQENMRRAVNAGGSLRDMDRLANENPVRGPAPSTPDRPPNARDALQRYMANIPDREPATAPAANLRDVPNRTDFQPARVAQELDAAADSGGEAPMPAALAAAPPVADEATARQVVNSIPTGRKPTIRDAYNMTMLVRSGVVTMKDAANYMRTGRFDPQTADYSFMSLSGDRVIRTNKTDGSMEVIDFGTGGTGADEDDLRKMFEGISDRYAGFDDMEPGQRRSMATQLMEGARDFFGEDVRGLTEQQTIDMFTAQERLRTYENKIANAGYFEGLFDGIEQNRVGTPTRFMSMVPAISASVLGINSQRQFDKFMEGGYRPMYENRAALGALTQIAQSTGLPPSLMIHEVVAEAWDQSYGDQDEFERLVEIELEKAVNRVRGQ